MPQATTNKFYIGIKNEVSTSTLELYFLDYIYDGFDWSTYEYVSMVQDTIKQVKAANPTTIKIYVNSLGGDVMIGLALYNFLKSYNAEKEVHVIGFAASIASVMAMCASKGKLYMAKNSFMIIHAAWSSAAGNATEIRAQADNLDKVSNELADIYAQRSGKEASYFTTLWANGDYWMTATEAKEMGLADELTEAEAINASIDVKSYGFKNIPAALLNAAIETPPAQPNFLNHLQDSFMKIIDQLKAAVTGGKENKATDALANKQEILDMVQAVLTPFAEAVDQALEKVKPATAATTTEAAATTENTETPAAPAATVEAKEPTEIEKLQAKFEAQEEEMKKLKAQIANSISRPTPAATASDKVIAGMNFETE